jgi:hypothetical protein
MGGNPQGQTQLVADPCSTLVLHKALMPFDDLAGDQPGQCRKQGTGEKNAVGTPAHGWHRSEAS